MATCFTAQVSELVYKLSITAVIIIRYASLFLHAVKDEEAAGYSEVVFR